MHSDGRSLLTSAAPSRVWEIWSRPQTWAEWNPDVISATLNGPFAPGTTGTLVTKQAKHRILLTSVDEGRSFSLEATPMPGMHLRFRCEIEPVDSGSRIAQYIEVSGFLSLLFGGPMAKQIAKTFEPILTALKQKAESRPAS